MMLRDMILCQRSLRPWEEVGVVTGKGAGRVGGRGGAQSELGGPQALHSPSFQTYGRPSASLGVSPPGCCEGCCRARRSLLREHIPVSWVGNPGVA